MKLAIFALLLISLSACENCAIANDTGKKEETTGTPGGSSSGPSGTTIPNNPVPAGSGTKTTVGTTPANPNPAPAGSVTNPATGSGTKTTVGTTPANPNPVPATGSGPAPTPTTAPQASVLSEKAAALLAVKDDLIKLFKDNFEGKDITNELQTLEDATNDAQKEATLKALVDAKNNYNETSLHLAAYEGHIEIVKILLDAGADKDFKTFYRYTPLHVAVYKNNKEIVEMLLKAGANKTIKNNQGKTPAEAATQEGHTDIADLINSYENTTPTAAPQASVSEKEAALLAVKDDLIKFCKDKFGGKDVSNQLKILKDSTNNDEQKAVALNELLEMKGGSNNNLLHYVANYNEQNIAEALIKAGADVNAKNNDNETPLHVTNNAQIAEALIKYGADVNAKNKNDSTPLHKAVHKQKLDLVEILIKNNAVLDYQDLPNGDTPLHLAVYSNNENIVKALLNVGANINLINNEKKTPAQVATQEGHTDIADLINSYVKPNP